MTPDNPQQAADDLDNLAERPTAPVLSGYFYGQMLDEKGLAREQLYGRLHDALLARLLGGAVGVLEGLEMELGQASPAGDVTSLVVRPGVAVDAIGRLVVVPDPNVRDLLKPNGKAGTATLSLPTKSVTDALSATASAAFDLILLPALEPIEQAPVLADDEECGASASRYEYSAFREGYRLALRMAGAADEPPSSVPDQGPFPGDPPAGFAQARPSLLPWAKRPARAPLKAEGVVLGRVSAERVGEGDKATYRFSSKVSPGPRRQLATIADLESALLGMADRVDGCLRRRSLIALGGDGQSGPRGEKLEQAIRAQVVRGTGQGVAGARVTFRVKAGGGSLSRDGAQWTPATDETTDEKGEAAAYWRLGASSLFNSVDASVARDPGMNEAGILSFLAWGEPPPPPPPAEDRPPGPESNQPAPEPHPYPGASQEPEPTAPPSEPPPRVVAMSPWSALGEAEAGAWKQAPTLSIQFDRPMLRDDLAEPSEWLRVLRVVRSPLPEESDAWVEVTWVPIEKVIAAEDVSVVYQLRRANEPPGGQRDVAYVVLISPRDKAPRSAAGTGLAAGFVGTRLGHHDLHLMLKGPKAPGEKADHFIAFDRCLPSEGAELPSGGADGQPGGLFHASFRLGARAARPAGSH